MGQVLAGYVGTLEDLTLDVFRAGPLPSKVKFGTDLRRYSEVTTTSTAKHGTLLPCHVYTV